MQKPRSPYVSVHEDEDSIADALVAQMVQRVVFGEMGFRSGERIPSVATLKNVLGKSHSPITAASKELERLGILCGSARAGRQVAPLSAEALAKIYARFVRDRLKPLFRELEVLEIPEKALRDGFAAAIATRKLKPTKSRQGGKK